MAGSTFGKIFQITTWGESHGKGIGVVVDGCPAGLPLSAKDVQEYLNKRKPGQSRYTTKRSEPDLVEIMSGVFEGKTTGTPISMVVRNNDHHSYDYDNIANLYRPGHADYGFDMKYGFRDYRGGGRSSGRETIGRVAAGAIATKLLEELGISILAYTKSIGDIEISSFDENEIENNPLRMPDAEAAAKATAYLEQCMAKTDSAGGVVECIVHGMMPGIGDPVFDKLDSNLAKAIMSIGAVKGFEIGDGFAATRSNGSINNDPFVADENGKISKQTNHAGGILGGMSDGSDLILRVGFKPTSSIAKKQHTVTRDHENTEVVIKGRHDPIIVPRGVIVVQAMVANTLADAILCGMSAKLEHVKKVWER